MYGKAFDVQGGIFNVISNCDKDVDNLKIILYKHTDRIFYNNSIILSFPLKNS